MIVTIVAKTRMGRGACIGAIAEDGRSVRLIASDADMNEQFNQEYQVGDVWQIDPGADAIIPPHTENILVLRKRRLGTSDDLPALIERAMPPAVGSPELLYGGLLQTGPYGSLYIAERSGVPAHSTQFWRPDRPLTRDTDAKRIRYRYPTEDGGHTLTFVGYQEPPPVIPAGTLLRVSMAHWWRPRDEPTAELRCYVQLSGWIASIAAAEPDLWPGEPDADEAALTLDEARRTLMHVFGYDTFRPLQADIIENMLAYRDSLAVMPTGSGKSICFQLPAVLFPGLTVVVSPLISLMEDQVMQLRQLGVPAACLNNTLSYSDYIAVVRNVRAGRIKLLYTSPETLLRPETLVMLDECRVDCLTIDEAHCISEWGHDFRPEYRQLVQVRRRLPRAVCLAATATATERVRRDIKQNLAIGDADEFVSSFDRENLFLSAAPRDDGLAQILSFLERHRGESGIIYCHTRKQVNSLTEQLIARGQSALPYHAGLDDATRRENQRRFTRDETSIIVATIAFGMGINKPNVRFVIHYNLPQDLESYYQQIGRAGRDGLPADCLLLSGADDVRTHNYLADKGAPDQRGAAAARLQAMIAFAETDGCRRRPLLAYFGEIDIPDTCGRCDNCLADPGERIDLTTVAQKFLSCIARTKQLFGASYIADILRGSRRKEILERGHDRLSTYAIGLEYSRKQWQQLARQFVGSGLLRQDMDHGSLILTDHGRAVLRGEAYMGTPPTIERAVGRAIAHDYDETLFEQLRVVRLDLARREDVPAFVVFSDATLREMAIYYPQTRESLGRMQGVGAIKLERYGDNFLPVIRDYCRERGLAERPKPTAADDRPRSSGRRREIAELYRQGRDVAELTRMFGVKPQTIIGYLWDSVREGEAIPAEPLLAASALSPEDQARVLQSLAKLGSERLRPIYDDLQETVSYDELHLLRLYYVAGASR